MIELTDWLRTELARRAEQEAPLEACGLISAARELRGDRKGKIGLWAAENVSQEPQTSFLIHPEEQTAILKSMWARGEDLAGVYHSHPRSAPEPSERDRQIAAGQPRPLVWVIVGLPRCPMGCDGTTDARCSECKDWGYVERFWVGELP